MSCRLLKAEPQQSQASTEINGKSCEAVILNQRIEVVWNDHNKSKYSLKNRFGKKDQTITLIITFKILQS